MANSVDPDQMPQNVASDLDQHCLSTPSVPILSVITVFSSTGSKWKIRRRMLTPTFHFKILHDFVHVFNDQSNVLLSKLKDHADGKPYNIFNDVTLCALDIICGE